MSNTFNYIWNLQVKDNNVFAQFNKINGAVNNIDQSVNKISHSFNNSFSKIQNSIKTIQMSSILDQVDRVASSLKAIKQAKYSIYNGVKYDDALGCNRIRASALVGYKERCKREQNNQC